MSSPPTPSSSPARPSRTTAHVRQGDSSAAAPQQFPQTFWEIDEYIVRNHPGIPPTFKSEKELKDAMTLFGATEATMSQYIDNLTRMAREQIERCAAYGLPPARVIGVRPHFFPPIFVFMFTYILANAAPISLQMKPKPDEAVYSLPIANTNLAIRIWEGGMRENNQYCLDFFDTRRRTAVNLPPNYSLWPSVSNMPGAFTMGGPLPSWEKALGYAPDAIPAGEEKWSVPAGSYITLKRGTPPRTSSRLRSPSISHLLTFSTPGLGICEPEVSSVYFAVFGLNPHTAVCGEMYRVWFISDPNHSGVIEL
ncbi:hypothetical protein C8Q74DRAFT_1371181 [Fomes fomentarius]|nr:hypothetical protein C8Q74DRAFT_1371181 [Fomes fomentarius]